MANVEQAALLLRALGESAAANVLRHLNPKEVQKIGHAMTQIGNVTTNDLEQVINLFLDCVAQQTNLSIGGDDYIRNLLTTALGEDKASNIIEQILHGGQAEALERLKWLSVEAIVELIRFEHPQIQTLVLCHLEADQAGAVISNLPPFAQTEIILRIARLTSVQPSAIMQLNAALEQQLSSSNNGGRTNLGGVKKAADILNFVDSANNHSLLDNLRNQDNALTAQIEECMFVFDDLANLDIKSLQTLLREVKQQSLLLALKGASSGVKNQIFASMSQRAAGILQDDLANIGPIRLSEVENAQKEILAKARKLAEDGTITLSSNEQELI